MFGEIKAHVYEDSIDVIAIVVVIIIFIESVVFPKRFS